MSWQSYIDSNLVGTTKVDKAAIIGINDRNIWAKSADLNIAPDELIALATAFTNPDQVQVHGLRINGKKYFALSANDESIQLKQGANGGCLRKTNRAVILGIYEPPVQQSECFTIVDALGVYLIGQSY